MAKKNKKISVGVISKLSEDGSAVDRIAKFGLDCAQIVSWKVEQCQMEIAKVNKKRLAEKGVRVAAFWAGYSGHIEWNFTRGPVTLGLVPPTYRYARVKELKNWAEFAVELGAPAIVTHCGFLPENMTDPAFEPVASAIYEVAERCKQLGIEFWFETGQETPVTLLRFIQEVGLDNLGINLDPANLILYGKGSPLDALDVFGKYVKNIHAKDALAPTDGRNLGREVRVGEGLVRYTEFLPKLVSCGFTGDFIIEREISEQEGQSKDIADTVKYLRKFLDTGKVPVRKPAKK